MTKTPLILLVFCLCQPLIAQPGPAIVDDPSQVLEQLGYRYDYTESGNLRCVFEVADTDRTQLVIIQTETHTYGNLEVWEIISPAFKDKRLKKNTLESLLKDSGRKKLGTWSVEEDPDDGKTFVLFTLRLPVNADPGEWNSALQYVAESADSMELRLSGEDTY